MRKNGFTLIELLAVIVILAIIALIATPIILGIINDAKQESQERSVELYATAVRNGIAAYQLTEGKEVAAGTYTSEELPFDVEYDGDVECTTIELYEDGGVYVAGCTVNGGEKTYNCGEQQEILVNFNDVCTPVTTATTGNIPKGNYALGDEYTCEVKEGTSYTFFVLSKEGNKVNLIMDANIRKDGTPVKDTTDLGLVAWLSIENYVALGGPDLSNDGDACQYGGYCVDASYGPISAMKHLAEATKEWKTGKLITSTFDEEVETHEMPISMNASARMPKLSEVKGTGCGWGQYESSSCPTWMVSNPVSGVVGYWTSTFLNPNYAWYVDYSGNYNIGTYLHNDSELGVRPVITLSI